MSLLKLSEQCFSYLIVYKRKKGKDDKTYLDTPIKNSTEEQIAPPIVKL